MAFSKRRITAFILASYLGVALSCGESATEPDPTHIRASIDGPTEVELNCLLEGLGKYKTTIAGQVQSVRWLVNGDTTGVRQDKTAEMIYEFTDKGPYTVTIVVMGTNGSVDSASVLTTASPPTNPADCAAYLKVDGRFALLLQAGMTSISSHYEAVVPHAIENIDSFVWLRSHLGEATVDTIASGNDVRGVDVSFGEAGDYQVSLDLIVDNETITTSRTVGVRTGEPVSEPGILVFFRRLPTDSNAMMYNMDLETGLVDGPVFSHPGLDLQNQTGCEPAGTRIVLTLHHQETNRNALDLWVVQKNGENLTRLTNTDGVTWFPSWSINGEIAYLDDTRSGGSVDELYIIPATGGVPVPVGGSSVNRDYIGFSTAWSPGGGKIALGSSDFSSDGVLTRFQTRVAVFDRDGGRRRTLHSVPYQVAYPGDYDHEFTSEGSNGLSWSPDGVWIAYCVILHNNSEDPFGVNYFIIARARADGSGDVQTLVSESTTPQIGIEYSLTGQHIYFSRYDEPDVNDPEADPRYIQHIFQMPADGGDAIDLSAITDPSGVAMDGLGCMMPLDTQN